MLINDKDYKFSTNEILQLKGLCGNYNDNELDDFQTPAGGLSEVSAKLFGDSWRLQSQCLKSEEIVVCHILLNKPPSNVINYPSLITGYLHFTS